MTNKLCIIENKSYEAKYESKYDEAEYELPALNHALYRFHRIFPFEAYSSKSARSIHETQCIRITANAMLLRGMINSWIAADIPFCTFHSGRMQETREPSTIRCRHRNPSAGYPRCGVIRDPSPGDPS